MNASVMEKAAHFDLVRFVYNVSAAGSFLLGMLLNVLLIYLIYAKTVKAMRIYSRLLLHSCVMVVDHGYRAVFQNGIFRNLPQPYAYMMNVLWIQMLLFFMVSTTTQFIFRYFLLSRDGQIPGTVLWLMGMFAIVLNLFHIVLLTWSDYPREHYREAMADLAVRVQQETGVTDVKFTSFTWARSFPWLCHVVVMVVLFSTCYIVIGVCAVKIRRYVGNTFARGQNKNAPSGVCSTTLLRKEKMREYNNEITRALIVQAVLPTFEAAAMLTQIFLPIFYPNDATVFIILYIAIPLYFAPVLNPLATILLVKPYRRAVLTSIFGRHVNNGATTGAFIVSERTNLSKYPTTNAFNLNVQQQQMSDENAQPNRQGQKAEGLCVY
uniref:G_PROTEIN_RECEP_F1_2 domain-containing protein n=1 Tax=Globodera pallida TaxID=36090 RepID=A0A183BI17_GLOPA